jgi:hypothetical protein
MSAADIFEKVKALPPAEQDAFANLYRRWQPPGAPARPAAAPRQWPDFLLRLRNIYGDKVTSDSQILISESRGER